MSWGWALQFPKIIPGEVGPSRVLIAMSQLLAESPTKGPFNILAALHAVPGLMTTDDVAKLLSKSNLTIRRMAASKRIPSARIGGDLRFDPSALMLWLSKKDPTLSQAAKQFGLAI